MATFVYHFCAEQQLSPGSVDMIDGIARLSHPVVSKEDYDALKVQISKITNKMTSAMVVTSLSLLHTEQ